ncbi:MAG TPA: protein phosphatase 2C domain-containing protein [Bacteroidales bacterium]|nr:protein phosphatase 2C domain-containing protein [Flavobacterium sp.]HZK08830.1 protein phosphatase 2C domain-containing protein [Bacteroidales bacterium]HZK22539.1 protein phosphatase 2C domain-containing protein [Atopostipes sp.]
MKYKTHLQTHIGGRKENQDYHTSQTTKFGDLVIVCDGMGGHKGGAVASKLAATIIAEEMNPSKSEDPVNALFNSIYKANFEIFRRGVQNPELKGMGTTLTCLLVTTEKAYSCHIGDSRIYQLRNGKIIFKTNDHSKVFELVKRGIINEEQARTHPDSNIIERAMGISPVVDVELHELSYLQGDRFLLCTDGIHGLLSDDEIVNIISPNNVEDATEKLIDVANQKGIDSGGGHDNMTAAIIEMDENSGSPVAVLNKKKSLMKTMLFPGALLIIVIMLFFLNETFRIEPVRVQNNSLRDSIHHLKDGIRNLETTMDSATKQKDEPNVDTTRKKPAPVTESQKEPADGKLKEVPSKNDSLSPKKSFNNIKPKNKNNGTGGKK